MSNEQNKVTVKSELQTEVDKLIDEQMRPKFPSFWYESNACYGWVDSHEDLLFMFKKQMEEHNSIYTLDDFLDKSKRSAYSDMDFGTRREHRLDYTLRQFLSDNKILDEFLLLYAFVYLTNK